MCSFALPRFKHPSHTHPHVHTNTKPQEQQARARGVTMWFTMMKSSSPHYNDDTCPECEEMFDTDQSLVEPTDQHRLPFTCSKCFYFTMCGVCLGSVDLSTFECPICNTKQFFDRDDPVPNLRLCSVLRKQQATEASNSLTPEHSTPARLASGAVKPLASSRKKAAATLDDGDNNEVGDRVYCLWPETNLYYWGYIVQVHKQSSKPTTYKVR